jgi:hypothetical protein
LTLPTPPEGPPLVEDKDIATAAAQLVERVLQRGGQAITGTGQISPLTPADIGISATHRAMNSMIIGMLPHAISNQESGVRVDTPERWQGLERKLMIVIHPLSAVARPSAFDLETGRLCVMASRHQAGLIVLSRDHVPQTLNENVPRSEQAPGRPDVTGRGHYQHSNYWALHANRGNVFSV